MTTKLVKREDEEEEKLHVDAALIYVPVAAPRVLNEPIPSYPFRTGNITRINVRIERTLHFEEYLQLQHKEKYAWYDFKEDKAFAFPTKGEKFLYEGMEACIIGVDSEGVFPVASCTSVMGKYKELGLEDLGDISPIGSPEVEKRLEHTLKGQCKLMKKFLNKVEAVKGDTLNNILEGLYDKGWRISKNGNKD